MRFPIIPDNIRKHQNILLNWPLFFSVAHSDKYLPSATQSIAAPKPLIAAANNIIVTINVLLKIQDSEVGFYDLNAGSINEATYIV